MTVKHKYRIVLLAILTLGWMGVIFAFSSQDGEASSKTSGRVVEKVIKVIKPDYETLGESERENFKERVIFFVRKGAHFTEYAILGMFLLGLFWEVRSFFQTVVLKKERLFAASWAVAVLYAVGDEIHQLFSAGRSPRAADVCIDGIGAAVGITITIFAISLYMRLQRRNGAGNERSVKE